MHVIRQLDPHPAAPIPSNLPVGIYSDSNNGAGVLLYSTSV